MLTMKSDLLELSPRRMHSAQATLLQSDHIWVKGYVRHGQRVRGHWRKRPVRLPVTWTEDVPMLEAA